MTHTHHAVVAVKEVTWRAGGDTIADTYPLHPHPPLLGNVFSNASEVQGVVSYVPISIGYEMPAAVAAQTVALFCLIPLVLPCSIIWYGKGAAHTSWPELQQAVDDACIRGCWAS